MYLIDLPKWILFSETPDIYLLSPQLRWRCTGRIFLHRHQEWHWSISDSVGKRNQSRLPGRLCRTAARVRQRGGSAGAPCRGGARGGHVAGCLVQGLRGQLRAGLPQRSHRGGPASQQRQPRRHRLAHRNGYNISPGHSLRRAHPLIVIRLEEEQERALLLY